MAKEYTAPTTVNSIVKLINRTGIGRSKTLTTLGRKSGELREVPVSPIAVDNETYLVAPYGAVSWVLNARADPSASLQSGRSIRDCRLVDVTGDVPHVVKAYYERETFPRRYMDLPESPTIEDFEKARELFPVFRVEDPA